MKKYRSKSDWWWLTVAIAALVLVAGVLRMAQGDWMTGVCMTIYSGAVLWFRREHYLDYKMAWRSGFTTAIMQDPTPITRDAVTGEAAPNPWDDQYRVGKIEFRRLGGPPR